MHFSLDCENFGWVTIKKPEEDKRWYHSPSLIPGISAGRGTSFLCFHTSSSDRGVGMSLRGREKVTRFKQMTLFLIVLIAWGQAILITGFLIRVGG